MSQMVFEAVRVVENGKVETQVIRFWESLVPMRRGQSSQSRKVAAVVVSAVVEAAGQVNGGVK